ncbi:MAG: HisA/HisF-related TIM barrel protein [Pirellulaceae bacterium]|nr:HisA/HisF-related TIM barrel protein [Pirellulaceae bacterium]
MQVIPVIDLMGGQVLRGVGGRRSEYRPIASPLAADARPGTVAKAFVEQFGFETVYVADLDAIMQGRPDVAAWQEIASAGLELWIDAGLADRHQIRRCHAALREHQLPARLVVGLETLTSPDELQRYSELAREKPIFSLDLKERQPLSKATVWQGLAPEAIAAAVEKMGLGELIVLDLADVGTNGGTGTLDLCRQLWSALRLRIIAGGGVRNLHDLQTLASVGCESALVASALHDGRLTVADVQTARQMQRPYAGDRDD